MKIIAIILSFSLFPTFVYALNKNNITIDSKLYFKGKKIGSPRITTLINKKAQVVLSGGESGVEYSLEITPQKVGKNKILLKYDFSVIENNKEMLSRGKILLADGSSGRVVLDGKTAELHFKSKMAN